MVTERFLHEELKLEKAPTDRHGEDGRKALVTDQRRRPMARRNFTCHFCHKPGHINPLRPNDAICVKFLLRVTTVDAYMRHGVYTNYTAGSQNERAAV